VLVFSKVTAEYALQEKFYESPTSSPHCGTFLEKRYDLEASYIARAKNSALRLLTGRVNIYTASPSNIAV
jgi:hypothetical protein